MPAIALPTIDRPRLAALACEVWTRLRRSDRPKSMTLTSQPRADLRTSRLAGFTSRWSTPASWAALRASAVWMATSSRSSGLSGPCRRMCSSKERLSGKCSISRYGRLLSGLVGKPAIEQADNSRVLQAVQDLGFPEDGGDVPVDPGGLEGFDDDLPVLVAVMAEERDPERPAAPGLALDPVLGRGPDGEPGVGGRRLPQFGQGPRSTT